jgi:hypothetical protein
MPLNRYMYDNCPTLHETPFDSKTRSIYYNLDNSSVSTSYYVSKVSIYVIHQILSVISYKHNYLRRATEQFSNW